MAYTKVVPGRNIIKPYVLNSYYHAYSRGVAKQPVFLDDEDYVFFLGLLKRYLSDQPAINSSRTPYPWYNNRLNLLAFCLMSNHIHLLIYQYDENALKEFMRSVMTSYSMYFNRKYKRVGPVFQSRYRASLIDHDNYLQHISRYIHLNPRNWQRYKYSSLPYYLDQKKAEWVKPDIIMSLFANNKKQYIDFMKDYEEYKSMLDEIKWELAHL